MNIHSQCRHSRISASGFSFIEVIACVIVLAVGVTAAVGMVMYGVFLATRAQGMATGMATAMSVADDPTPLLPATSSWTRDGTTGNARGYVNGFYVERTETAGAGPGFVLPDGFQSAIVTVKVFDGLKGRPITSYSTRILRQANP